MTGVGAGAAAGPTGDVNVGLLLNSVNSATARGSMTLDGALAMNGRFLQLGQIFNAGRGSLAEGSLRIGGEAGTVGNGGLFLVGNIAANGDAQIGSRATGQLSVLNGGGLTLAVAEAYIGTTLGIGRVVDNGTLYFDEAYGTALIDGTLRFTTGPNLFLIGYTSGGIGHGSLDAGTLDMEPGARIVWLSVGQSGTGAAIGSLTAGGGTLRAVNVVLGNSNGGTAEGSLSLSNAFFEADSVLAGTGTFTPTQQQLPGQRPARARRHQAGGSPARAGKS